MKIFSYFTELLYWIIRITAFLRSGIDLIMFLIFKKVPFFPKNKKQHG